MSEVQNFEIAESMEEMAHCEKLVKYSYNKVVWMARLNQYDNIVEYCKQNKITKQQKDDCLTAIGCREYMDKDKKTDYSKIKDFLNNLAL
jgi:hypothetical protein